ncbi:MAG TPA: M1 family metallopeptidase [Mycobacteriales bacterium]|jgi:aminopeptidase N|nr:M1 family metallopeptidase [Mycobacteriales bacterium]
MRTRRFLVMAVLAAGSLLVGTPAVAAPAGPAAPVAGATPLAPVPGAEGVGDPYFPLAGNGGYDVRSYGLDLRYDPATRRLAGTAAILATATRSLSRFDLDLRGFTVSSVTVNARRATWTRSGQELVITPARPLRRGLPFLVTVRYAGVPQVITDPDESIEGFVPTDDGAFVVGEPQGAPGWFPSNDHPIDKATMTLRMTVPAGITAVGNGRLLAQTTRAGHTTFVWNESKPMATYLATITLGRFDVHRTTAGRIPVYVALDPREAAEAKPVTDRIPEVIAWEQSVFGRYPFETVGAIVDRAPDVGYALESQTKPNFDSAPDIATLVHELAHQWYGDSVSLSRWQDIWLNEGFATYAEWLWSEHTGADSAQALFDEAYARPATSAFWTHPAGDPGGPENLFGSPSYDRGAMTLHALRVRIGDRAFFRLLRAWAQRYRYGNVTTAQFVALAERISRRQLDRLFDVWLYQPGKPTSW